MQGLDFGHFENISLPFIQIIILVFGIMWLAKDLIFGAKKINLKNRKQTNFEKIFEKIYTGHKKGENFQNLDIEPDLKIALEKYFYGGEKNQKQNILNLGKKYQKQNILNLGKKYLK